MTSEAASRARCRTAILLLGCTVLAGCGSSGRVTATGMVTFDGQPVETGTIVFQPLDRAAAPEGAPISGGRYTVECPPGRQRVQIRGTRPVDESRVPRTMPRLGTAPVREDYIPAAYNTESTLEVEVVAGGSNVFDFKLTPTPNPSFERPVVRRMLDVDFDHGGRATAGLGSIADTHGR